MIPKLGKRGPDRSGDLLVDSSSDSKASSLDPYIPLR